jgi:hypothetical protein
MKREHEYRAWDGHKMYYASLDDLVFSQWDHKVRATGLS